MLQVKRNKRPTYYDVAACETQNVSIFLPGWLLA
jgi:hypothetical protein